MKQSLGLVSLVVHDYDEALAFFVGKLGFLLVEDSFVPERAKRWVVITPPGAMETRLLLAKASTPDQESRIGTQTGGRVFLFLYTDNFWRDYERYKAQGITFVREPKDEPFGTVAVFQDLYGNLWDLLEPKTQTKGAMTPCYSELSPRAPVAIHAPRTGSQGVASRTMKLSTAFDKDYYTTEEFQEAGRPIASLISKSENTQQKLLPGTWQHTMLRDNLEALYIAFALMKKETNATDGLTRDEFQKALRAFEAMISRTDKAQSKFPLGTSQHTLMQNRLKALRIAKALTKLELKGHNA